MEDGLRVHKKRFLTFYNIVLILVLVEDGLRVLQRPSSAAFKNTVLILVLVEDGLRD